MRDRLSHLLTSSEVEEVDADGGWKVEFFQQAVVFSRSTVMDDLLKEVHSMRQELSLLQLEVQRLDEHGTAIYQLPFIKHDTNSIAMKIQLSGEALHARVKALGEQSTQLEESEGADAAVTRIARSQYSAICHSFHAAMASYSRLEENQKSVCRRRMQRQASILGKEISEEQMDTLVEKGGEGWAELSQSLQTEGRSSREALFEIQGRHTELLELEDRLKDLRDLFVEMDMLVEEQCCMVNNIESNVSATHDYIEKGNMEIKKAQGYKSKNPFTQCCSYLNCW